MYSSGLRNMVGNLGCLFLENVSIRMKILEFEGIYGVCVCVCVCVGGFFFFSSVGHQLCWNDYFNRFLLSRCLYMCGMDVGYLSTKKVNLRFFYENAMTVSRKTWYVDSGGHKHYPCGLSSPIVLIWIPHLHICSDWLVTRKANI